LANDDALEVLNALKEKSNSADFDFTCPICGKTLKQLPVQGEKGRFYTHPKNIPCKARYRTKEEIVREREKIRSEAKPEAPSEGSGEEYTLIGEEKQFTIDDGYIAFELPRSKYYDFNGDRLSVRELIRATEKALGYVDIDAFLIASDRPAAKNVTNSSIPRVSRKRMLEIRERRGK
jgi:hypothetical protein